MMGRTIEINFPPQRIISLVPSQTELLYDIGLDHEVVGITKFCVHPDEWFRTKQRVGGTKTVHIKKIKELQPDLIIANKEENTREQIEVLAALFPVWISDIKTVDEGLQMIEAVGEITDTANRAKELVHEIADGFDRLKSSVSATRVAYFIWRNPWMTVGGDTFISDMIRRMGWKNVFDGQVRYPEVLLQELEHLNIDKVLLSSEPYPFKEIHLAEIRAVLPQAEIRLVDGEMFSWYGSRMKLSTGYFAELLKSER